MLSVNNQRRPSVGANVTSSIGITDGNVQTIINNTNDSTSNNGQTKSPPSTSPTITGNSSSNGHFPITEPRSRSSSASSLQSSSSYLQQTDLPGVYSQLELWSNSSLQQQNIVSAEIDADLTTNEATFSERRNSPPSPVSTNADGSNVSSPTTALTRRDHIAGHTHDRSRSASFDGEIEPSAWTLDRVLEWLDDNSFSEYKTMFIEFIRRKIFCSW
ncbi:hypothetical protein C1645_473446 [Glomus cerebriforme]|uniref:SAM domain-containing protein n=1 Tax=Glomus cerebriforme TaxID=658196 RepID=A0A397SK61_9GLOM|nr:hypothetical protein C1645_473446 [Glomus cerebriforme]